MQQQQAQQLEAQATQELAEPQPTGLRERIGFVGAGQVPARPLPVLLSPARAARPGAVTGEAAKACALPRVDARSRH